MNNLTNYSLSHSKIISKIEIKTIHISLLKRNLNKSIWIKEL